MTASKNELRQTKLTASLSEEKSHEREIERERAIERLIWNYSHIHKHTHIHAHIDYAINCTHFLSYSGVMFQHASVSVNNISSDKL